MFSLFFVRFTITRVARAHTHTHCRTTLYRFSNMSEMYVCRQMYVRKKAQSCHKELNYKWWFNDACVCVCARASPSQNLIKTDFMHTHETTSLPSNNKTCVYLKHNICRGKFCWHSSLSSSLVVITLKRKQQNPFIMECCMYACTYAYSRMRMRVRHVRTPTSAVLSHEIWCAQLIRLVFISPPRSILFSIPFLFFVFRPHIHSTPLCPPSLSQIPPPPRQ